MSVLYASINTSGLIAYGNRFSQMQRSVYPSPHPLWKNPVGMVGRRVCSYWPLPQHRSQRELTFQFHIERASPTQRFRSRRFRQSQPFWSEWIRNPRVDGLKAHPLQRRPFAAAPTAGCTDSRRLLVDSLTSETELNSLLEEGESQRLSLECRTGDAH